MIEIIALFCVGSSAYLVHHKLGFDYVNSSTLSIASATTYLFIQFRKDAKTLSEKQTRTD